MGAPVPSVRVGAGDPEGAHKIGRAVADVLERVDRGRPRSVLSRLRGWCWAEPGHGALLILCIGTDRATGDALGPLVGTELELRQGTRHGFLSVYGTLEEPVHATNLQKYLARIDRLHPGVPIVAVDACLGRTESVGTIAVEPGPLRPGAAVYKALPPVGDVSITGVVNVGGFMEHFVLQNTRLSLVVKMARAIADGLATLVPPACHLGAEEAADEISAGVQSTDDAEVAGARNRRARGSTDSRTGTVPASSPSTWQ